MTDKPQSPKLPVRFFFFGALGELLFGYDSGIAGVALLSIKKEFLVSSPALSGFIVSSLLLGAIVGVGTSGRLADRMGRRPVLLIICMFFIVGGAVTAFAPYIWVLILGRMIMGLGVGGSAGVVTAYLVEIAPTQHRGTVGSLGQMMVVSGILIAYLVGYALQPHDAWRWMLGVSIIPAVLLAVGLHILPESPRWLVSKGRDAEALKTLKRLNEPDPDGELQTLQISHAKDIKAIKSTSQVLREMFSPGVRRNTIAAVLLAVLVQFIGTNAIIYYAPIALVHAGLSTSAAVAANVGVGIVNVGFTILGLAWADRLPRRTLLGWGIAGMTTAMVYLMLVSLIFRTPSMLEGAFALAGMLLFQGSFSVSWGLLVRVVVSELFPSSIRGSATGLVLVLNWAANFVVSQIFPSLLAFSAVLSFGIFAVMGVISFIFIRTLLPETGSGRSLEEIAPQAAAKS